jgi:hypothetical protein
MLLTIFIKASEFIYYFITLFPCLSTVISEVEWSIYGWDGWDCRAQEMSKVRIERYDLFKHVNMLLCQLIKIKLFLYYFIIPFLIQK